MATPIQPRRTAYKSFQNSIRAQRVREAAKAMTFLACCTLSSPAIHVATVAGPQALYTLPPEHFTAATKT